MRCKHCKEKFVQKAFLQKYCMEKDECIAVFLAELRAKKAKENQKAERDQLRAERAEVKKMSEQLKRHSDWLNDLQKVFNQYIRTRDKNKPCVSCGCDMTNRKGDASHYYAVSIAPSIRFDEDNVHLACVPCNQYKSGNLIEYGLRLPSIIGKERFDSLSKKRHMELKLSIPEIKVLIEKYKSLVKNPK